MQTRNDLRRVYIDSFVRRAQDGVDPAMVVRDGGVYGVSPSPQTPGRLLVVDDMAVEHLAGLGEDLARCFVAVFADAPQCVELLSQTNLGREDASAMVCRDVGSVPRLPIPAGLTVERVHRVEADPPGVALASATEACTAADPDLGISADWLAENLRTRAPASTQLFAATDADGAVRATSGCFVVASECGIVFVSTDRTWRGQGVGTAMTAWAIQAAASSGAGIACLDATRAGKSIYLRLGFEDVGSVSRFLPR